MIGYSWMSFYPFEERGKEIISQRRSVHSWGFKWHKATMKITCSMFMFWAALVFKSLCMVEWGAKKQNLNHIHIVGLWGGVRSHQIFYCRQFYILLSGDHTLIYFQKFKLYISPTPKYFTFVHVCFKWEKKIYLLINDNFIF